MADNPEECGKKRKLHLIGNEAEPGHKEKRREKKRKFEQGILSELETSHTDEGKHSFLVDSAEAEQEPGHKEKKHKKKKKKTNVEFEEDMSKQEDSSGHLEEAEDEEIQKKRGKKRKQDILEEDQDNERDKERRHKKKKNTENSDICFGLNDTVTEEEQNKKKKKKKNTIQPNEADLEESPSTRELQQSTDMTPELSDITSEENQKKKKKKKRNEAVLEKDTITRESQQHTDSTSELSSNTSEENKKKKKKKKRNEAVLEESTLTTEQLQDTDSACGLSSISNSEENEKKKKKQNEAVLEESTLQNTDHTSELTSNHTSEENQKKKKKKKKPNEADTEEGTSTPTTEAQSEILSTVEFSTMDRLFCDEVLRAIDEMGLKRLTKIQVNAIIPLMTGRDVIGMAKTGSGKTLAFLIPIVQKLHLAKFEAKSGTGAIIISPTRELASQIYEVLQSLTKYLPSLTIGIVKGKTNKRLEARALKAGVNILVATPGRLLDHLGSTKDVSYHRLKFLVIDEADRILECGFEEDMKNILSRLPSNRQTALFSATMSEKISNLTARAIKPDAARVQVERENDVAATVAGLTQYVDTRPIEQRLVALFRVITKFKRLKKIMVFFNCNASVEFYSAFFNTYYPVWSLYGKKTQADRNRTFAEFRNTERGVLFCTDVASRGLDIPGVDWVFHYDAPSGPAEYLHRVGRTARGEGKSGTSLLMLKPKERGFVLHLRRANIHPTFKSIQRKLIEEFTDIPLMRRVKSDPFLFEKAKEAFRGFLKAYKVNHLQAVFNTHDLDLDAVARSFLLEEPPSMDFELSKKRKRKFMHMEDCVV